MRKTLTGIGLILNLIWYAGCEFELPTTPSLPDKWNSKLSLPLLDRTYSFASLVRTNSNTNPIYADSSGLLYYQVLDSSSQSIKVDPQTFWKMPSVAGHKTVDLRKSLKLRADSTALPITTALNVMVDSSNNRVMFGRLDNTFGLTGDGQPFNQLRLSAQLSDTFPNPLRVKLTGLNFKDNGTGRLVSDSLELVSGQLSDTLDIAIDSDSLIGGTLTQYLDTLKFSLSVQVGGKMMTSVSRLNQTLKITVQVGQLHFDAFYGAIYASGYLRQELNTNDLAGATQIQFDSATATFTITDPNGLLEQIKIAVGGKKRSGAMVTADSAWTVSASPVVMAVGSALSNLPDSLIVAAQGIFSANTYHQSDLFPSGFDLQYTLFAPLRLTVPEVLEMASGKSSLYFIKDSTTRSRVIRAQEGAEVDLEVENRTPLAGAIYFLISNYDLFPLDTVGGRLPAGYFTRNDSIFSGGTDTTLVRLDTLAIIPIPPAEWLNNELLLPGRSQQIYRTDSTALAMLADTCYLRPHFRFVNPDRTQAVFRQDQSIRIRSYLNLLFDGAVLNKRHD